MDEYFEHSPINRLPRLLLNKRKDIDDVGSYGELNFQDLKRIDLQLFGDIFSDECVSWRGESKGDYAVISYKAKKVSLKRLLYHNFIDDLTKDTKLLQTCNTKLCCTIGHITAI